MCRDHSLFGGLHKLFHIHFRNITAPLPEGFIDNLSGRRVHGHVQS